MPELQSVLREHTAAMEDVIVRAQGSNPWFTPEFSRMAIQAIADDFLDQEKVYSWVSAYPLAETSPKNVGIVMAGNLPLVGFHDLLCVLASGHKAIIKCSDKDNILLPWLTDLWVTIAPELHESIQYADRFEGFDAVIATGSNNSSRYFEYYFKSCPHVLRKNRNGVAVITGEETDEELRRLADDIFLYFGLGCRNVSKVFVPAGYDFNRWQQAISGWAHVGDHHKYANNLDYNFAIYIINSVPHIHLGHLILKEDQSIGSRIACLHYSYYDERTTLEEELKHKAEEIQCIVSMTPIQGWEHVSFGHSQRPHLSQYADGVDTMRFLTAL